MSTIEIYSKGEGIDKEFSSRMMGGRKVILEDLKTPPNKMYEREGIQHKEPLTKEQIMELERIINSNQK